MQQTTKNYKKNIAKLQKYNSENYKNTTYIYIYIERERASKKIQKYTKNYKNHCKSIKRI